MTHGTVSVVMPSYNARCFIGEAIESVLNQSYPDLELIVVDDGSTDDTPSVVRRYSPTVQLWTLPHTGMPGLVRNRGIERARGAFIAFLDADDVWMKHKLEFQLQFLSRRADLNLVHSNLEMIDAQGKYLRDAFRSCPGSQGLSDDRRDSSFTQLIKGDSGIWTSSVMLKRACLDAVGLFDESLAITEDWHLWIRVARHFRIGFQPEMLAQHRRHTTNLGLSWVPGARPPEIELWRKVMQLYPDLEAQHGALIRAKCAFHYLHTAARCFKLGHYGPGARLLKQLTSLDLGRGGLAEFARIIAKSLRRQWLQRGPCSGGRQ